MHEFKKLDRLNVHHITCILLTLHSKNQMSFIGFFKMVSKYINCRFFFNIASTLKSV